MDLRGRIVKTWAMIWWEGKGGVTIMPGFLVWTTE